MTFGFPASMELPTRVRRIFGEIDTSFSCVGDDGDLGKYMPIVRIPIEAYTRFLGAFGRVASDSSTKYYQYLFVWNGQLFPPHPMDYEPVIVEVHQKAAYKGVIYDKRHYNTGRRLYAKKDEVFLEARLGWHSFKPCESVPQTYRIQLLTDTHLRHWWSVPDRRAQLLMKKKLRIPFLINGTDDYRDTPHNTWEITIDWIKYPLFSLLRRTETLAACMESLWNNVVERARRWLPNPGYKEYAAGFLALASALENYGMIILEPSLSEKIEGIDIFETGVSHASILKKYASQIEDWKLEDVKSSDDGNEYFRALRDVVRRDFGSKAHAGKWSKRFEARIKDKFSP